MCLYYWCNDSQLPLYIKLCWLNAKGPLERFVSIIFLLNCKKILIWKCKTYYSMETNAKLPDEFYIFSCTEISPLSGFSDRLMISFTYHLYRRGCWRGLANVCNIWRVNLIQKKLIKVNIIDVIRPWSNALYGIYSLKSWLSSIYPPTIETNTLCLGDVT